MKKIQIVFALVAVLLVARAANAVQDLDRLYIINGLAETLSMIDRAGDSVVANVMPLGSCPNRIRATGNLLLVANSCSDDLMVIDRDTYAVLHTVSFTVGDNPWDVVVVDDSLCAVSLLVANQVAIVNYQLGVERRRFNVGPSPEGLLMVVSQLWVANTGFDFGTYLYGQGSVSVCNMALTSVQASINVGTNPQAMALGADAQIHIVCSGNYTDRAGIVYTMDRDSWQPTDSIPIGGSPGDLAVGVDGLGYLAAGGFSDSGEVYRYDTRSHAVLNGPGNPWKSARGVLNVLPRAEGGVFTVCFSADSVVGLSLTGALKEKWQVGDGPGYAAHVTNRVAGDLNDDGKIDVLDVVEVINVAFRGASMPVRANSADVNADCQTDVIDVVSIINVAFRGGHGLYWGCVK